MAKYSFSTETKQDVISGIAQAIGYDKPPPIDPGVLEAEQIVRMTLVLRDGMDHERNVIEWGPTDLRGPGRSCETVFHGVEKAACRFAAYQHGGECVFILYFHTKNQDNRTSFYFKIPGGQEMQSLSLTSRRGAGMSAFGGGEGGGGLDGGMRLQEASIAERTMQNMIGYMTERDRRVEDKESRIDAKMVRMLDAFEKREERQQLTIQTVLDRDMKVREIEIAADGLVYEQKKKQKEDEDSEALKNTIIEGLKEHGPKLLMAAFSMIQRRNGEAIPPEVKEWFAAEQKKTKKPKAKPSSNAVNGDSANTNGTAPVSPSTDTASSPSAKIESEPEIEDAEEVEEEEDSEPTDIDKLRLNVALGSAQFMSLVRARGRWDAVRAALAVEALALWDALDEATASEDVASDQGIENVAKLALMFGGMAQADPGLVVALLGTLDDFCKVSLMNLTKSLEEYHNASRSS